MKILKVELQNINSLKSETPFVVNFESDHFQNVGLFVITGATGSGKTTILDAITVALYHKVPRFINTKSKLENIVSYGANTAFSTVTFKNNNQIYEAQWSIRTVSKTGQVIKPKEEYRLKNLTTKKILASNKKQVNEKIEEITQLNYNQFLRSMMLAQGEFAAFLSAPSKEKATLLEQITGEDIYKKIGDNALRRLAIEKKKLLELNYGLSDLVLNEEDRKQFENKQVETINLINENTISLNALKTIIDWYKTQKQLEQDKVKLEENKTELALSKANNYNDIKLLKKHVKAEPFSLDINEVNQLNLRINEYKKELDNYLVDETKQNELILKSETEFKNINQYFIKAENELNKWQPIIKNLTKLEFTLNNEINQKKQLNIELDKTKQQNQQLVKQQFEFNENKKQIQSKIENNNNTLSKIKHLANLENDFGKISAIVSNINQEKKQILQIKNDIFQKTELLQKTKSLLSQIEPKLENITKKELELNNQINQLKSFIDKHNIQNLFNKKEEINKQLRYLEQYKQQQNLLKEKNSQLKNVTANLVKINELFQQKQKQLKTLINSIANNKIMVADAKELVKLNNTISNLENERTKLQNGKPCQLCGSIHHPLVNEYKKINVSNSEKELRQRELNLEKLLNNQLNQEKELKVNETEIKGLNQQKITLTNDVNQIENIINEIKNNINKTDTTNSLLEKIKALNLKINDVNDKISLKEKYDKQLSELRELQNKLKNDSITLSQNSLNFKNNLNELKANKEKLLTANKLQVDALNLILNKHNLSINNFDNLLTNIELKIKDYKRCVEVSNTLLNDLKILNLKQQNNNKLLDDINNVINDLTNKINNVNKEINDLKTKRHTILSSSITVNEKENELKTNFENLKTKLLKAKENLDNLKLNQKTLKVKIDNTEKNLSKTNQQLKIKNNLINKNLKNSIFKSLEELKQHFLSNDNLIRIKKIDKEIEYQSIKITTLENKLKNSIKKHALNKNFNKTYESASNELIQITEQNNAKQMLLGEIKEKLKADDEIKQKNKLVYNKITAQEITVKKWDTLLKLLGGSKDAFNTYVQRLTLAKLIDLANQHLEKLNDRYALKLDELLSDKVTDILNFSLVDYYQTNQVRNVETSSGGEKFIISLALALGLSDLSSNNVKIDSLFIDEGFGTLDNNTLEIVISTLETLQQQGKMIGVISHVENLKDRISTQIKITKKSNGVSTLAIV